MNAARGEAIAEGRPHLAVADEDRETVADLLAELLLVMLGQEGRGSDLQVGA